LKIDSIVASVVVEEDRNLFDIVTIENRLDVFRK